jgi:nucleotide-binding universal stress UspA family protein
MAFKDVLLCLPTYPEAASADAVDEAVRVCAGLAASAALIAPEVRFRYSKHPLAEALLHISELATAIEQRSSEAAAALAARFEEKAHGLGIYGGYHRLEGESYEFPDTAARLARTRDLCIIPYCAGAPARQMSEAVIFGSGRPTLIYGQGQVDGSFRSGKVLVAWDGGRAAARAVADALPLMQSAEVEVVTLVGEKATAQPGSTEPLAQHLARHGVDARFTEIPHGQAPVERTVVEHARERGADLLVMGAFGRSSLREFLLGGVTDSILEKPPLPVFLAH